MDLAKIPGNISLNPGAASEAIAFASHRLHSELPEEYATFLGQANGVVADGFVLYSCEDQRERNETFAVGESAPGYVTVGDDNGGREIMLPGGAGPSPVFLVDHGSMQVTDMVRVADSLSEWIETGCPTDMPG